MRTEMFCRPRDAQAARYTAPPAMSATAPFALTLLLGILVSLTALGTDAWLPALPVAADALGAPVVEMQLTVTTYFLGLAAGQLVWGPLSDRYGRRPVLMAGLGLALGASLVAMFAASAGALIWLRLAQGFGMSAGPVIARTVARDLYANEQAAHLLARMTLVFSIIPIAAPLAGGILVTFAGWQAVFAMLAVVAAALIVRVALRLDETAPALRASMHPATVLRTFASILAEPRFRAPFSVMLCAQIGIFAFVANSSFTLMRGMGVTPPTYAMLFAIVMLGQIAGAWASSRLVVRLGIAKLLRIGTALAAVSGLLAALLAWAGLAHPAAVVLPFMAFLGACALIVPSATAAALTPFPKTAGTASSLMGATQFVLGAAVATLLGALYDGSARPMATLTAVAALAAFVLERWTARRSAAQA